MSRLGDELHHHVERFIRVVDHEILLPDRREAIAPVLAHPFREAGIVGLEFQLGPIHADEFRKVVQRQHPFDREALVRGGVEFVRDEQTQRFGHPRIDLQPDDGPSPASLQGAFEEENEVLRLFFDLEIAVANDPEQPLAHDLITREQQSDLHPDQGFEGDETGSTGRERVRQADETLAPVRNPDQRVKRASVVSPLELERQREPEVRDKGGKDAPGRSPAGSEWERHGAGSGPATIPDRPCRVDRGSTRTILASARSTRSWFHRLCCSSTRCLALSRMRSICSAGESPSWDSVVTPERT